MNKILYWSILFSFLVSCTKRDQIKESIESANMYLSDGKCAKAIKLLEKINDEEKDENSDYLQTLASAYACKGGFKEPKFFSDDLPNTTSPSPLGGVARYSTSDDMEYADDEKFLALQDAIDTLLYAGGLDRSSNPTIAKRQGVFSEAILKKIHSQLFFMIMAQLGRFFRFYGGASPEGKKGNCFVEYENLPFTPANITINTRLAAGAATNTCTAAGQTGSPYLGSGVDGNINISRLCYGVVLINNFFDLISEVASAFAGDDVDVLDDLTSSGDTLRRAILIFNNGTYNLNDILDVKGHAKCVSDNATDDNPIQVYSAFYLEGLII